MPRISVCFETETRMQAARKKFFRRAGVSDDFPKNTESGTLVLAKRAVNLDSSYLSRIQVRLNTIVQQQISRPVMADLGEAVEFVPHGSDTAALELPVVSDQLASLKDAVLDFFEDELNCPRTGTEDTPPRLVIVSRMPQHRREMMLSMARAFKWPERIKVKTLLISCRERYRDEAGNRKERWITYSRTRLFPDQ